ncbi:hypothetical protein ABID25_005612 [Mesorhizobium abyssinicae]
MQLNGSNETRVEHATVGGKRRPIRFKASKA